MASFDPIDYFNRTIGNRTGTPQRHSTREIMPANRRNAASVLRQIQQRSPNVS